MANLLEFAKIFQTGLDKMMLETATSSWMEKNAGLVKYSGGDEVKIPKLTMQGLGNYSRANGYVAGDVTLEFETRKLTQDRGRSFQIDSMDVDETGFIATIPNIMGEFQRTKVVPEVDAYRYSTLAKQASIKKDIDIDETNIFSELLKDINAIQDVVGDIPLVITLNKKLSPLLSLSKEFSKLISMGDFQKGEISTKVKKIDEHFIIEVPSARMKTEYTFAADGAGGFTPGGGAKDINWIICPLNGPIAVSKTDKIRIFDPNTNQAADAWKTDYRKYHDIWVLDNVKPAVMVSKRTTNLQTLSMPISTFAEKKTNETHETNINQTISNGEKEKSDYSSYSLEDLKSIAKEKGVEGLSKLNKADLIQALKTLEELENE